MHIRYRCYVMVDDRQPRQIDELLAGVGLDVVGVDHDRDQALPMVCLTGMAR
ncbi:MAG: hypothetical protein ACXWCY_16470 [Burkholderiales bacterium]